MTEKYKGFKVEASSKSILRGTMNEEELRYNKSILREISLKKKE
jgi:hypothetical protein